MTNQQPPAQFDWATELSDAQGHVTLSKQEAKEIGARLRRLHAESEMRRTALLDEMQKAARLGAELETLRAKIKTYEDLGDAGSDVQLLRMGYAAARPEIESLQARIKTMAEEHADELMVAHLDGMRAAQPASGLDPELGPMLDFANAGEIAFYDYAVAQHCRATLDILDGKDNGAGACNEPWASVRKRLLSIVELHQSSSASHGQAPAQAAPAAVAVPSDTFRGDTTCLVQSIIALLELDAEGALVPHGIGGHARALLSAAASRLAAAPTTPQADSQPAPSTDQVEEILRERDDAEDFIDVLLDEVLGHERPEWSSAYGRADALNDVQERMTALHKPAVDKAWGRFQSAMAAPQQEAQEPCPTCIALARTVMLDQVSFDRKPDCYGIRQITDDEGVEEWEDIRTSPDVAREEANDMMATGRGEIYEVVPLWTTPQHPPAAQAGAVPLTKEQRNRIVLTADTVSEAIDMVERHHGIKGGQHGAE